MAKSLAYIILFLPLFCITAYLLPGKKQWLKPLQITALAIVTIAAALLWHALFIKAPLHINFGNWPVPYGVSFQFNIINVLLLLVFYCVCFAINLFSFADLDLKNQRSFYLAFWLLLFAITGLLTTQDIFNFYVWVEVVLGSSLIVINTTTKKNIISLTHYAIFSILGTLLMLFGIAAIYTLVGALNYQSIALFISTHPHSIIFSCIGLFVFSVFIKAAVFPLYFWLPKAYPDTSNSSTMLLSSLVTKALIFSILNFFVLWRLYQFHTLVVISIVLACLTMFFGVMGAANQFNIKKILSFHIISQLGYILLAILVPGITGFVAMLFLLIHNIIVKTGLLMTSAVVENKFGTVELNNISELRHYSTFLSCIFLLFALSLAGFPPFSGFWAKLLLLKALVIAHDYIAVTIAIIVSLYTLYSMLKIWRMAYSEPSEAKKSGEIAAMTVLEYLPLIILMLLMLFISLYPNIIIQAAMHAGIPFGEHSP